jgi:SulP family sulfate permease
MPERFKFDRMELAGSLGDIGTLLPIAIAMVLFNGLNPIGLFLSIGVFYVVSGIYFGVTVPPLPSANVYVNVNIINRVHT